jgi:hypothetical protein
VGDDGKPRVCALGFLALFFSSLNTHLRPSGDATLRQLSRVQHRGRHPRTWIRSFASMMVVFPGKNHRNQGDLRGCVLGNKLIR